MDKFDAILELLRTVKEATQAAESVRQTVNLAQQRLTTLRSKIQDLWPGVQIEDLSIDNLAQMEEKIRAQIVE